MAATFGIDFGTTNSSISIVAMDHETGKPAPHSLLNRGKPHPSVVWYHGTDPVVGQRAKERMSDIGLGVFGDIVRSPKMFLGSPAGINVGGVVRKASDIVADILRFLREDAVKTSFRGNPFKSAVITIPVNMRGQARAELRVAALKAGMEIHQFIHEPLAALYAYFRRSEDFRRTISSLEKRIFLVFDWGGGTLDLTLCQMRNGVLMQIANTGDSDVGGDAFDLRLLRLAKEKHSQKYPKADWTLMQPTAESRLIQACEDAKIRLSEHDGATLDLTDILAVSGPEKDMLNVKLERTEFENVAHDLVVRGLKKIEQLLERAGLSSGSIDFCLATGGMISMPAIQDGLRGVFGMSRLRIAENAACIISEGAAWIAHDRVCLKTAKPVEILHADNSFVEIVPSGAQLPFAGETINKRMDMYCVDPSDGFAKFLFARPKFPGLEAQGDERIPYAHISLPVDTVARPLFERLKLNILIDEDLIAKVEAFSEMSGERREIAIHDLEFGLNVGGTFDG